MQLAGGDEPGAIAARTHGWLWRCCLSIAWLATLTLFVVAVLRIVYQDASNILTCINAFTLYLYLPAYACLAWAAWQRRYILASLALVVAGCHIAWVVPHVVPGRRLEPSATSAGTATDAESPTLRVFFANVAAHNEDPAGFLHEIPLVDPDVIVFVEFFPWWQPPVAASTILKSYPYGTTQGEPRGGEFAVYSKIPIENSQKFWAARRMSYSFDVRLGGEPLRVFCLHAPRPMDLPLHDYQGFWSKTSSLLLSLPDPAIVVGDFNATPFSRVMATLTADRLRSAHHDRGRGLATTWPNGEFLIPPIRIDHALLSSGVECVDIQEGLGRGSDHKPLILDIRLQKRSMAGHATATHMPRLAETP